MFSYSEAFSRNHGLTTQAEQERLKTARVAIAGLGGVGGFHFLTLVRMGVTRFSLSEFDRFELVNFNRQVGATMRTIGHPKLDVMVEMALAINPDLDLRIFGTPLSADNLPDFLAGADVFIDSLDFFVPEIREQVFSLCHKNRIPVVTAGPLGISAAWMVFMPGGPSFQEYFRFDRAATSEEKVLHFIVGLSPRLLQRSHIVDFSSVDFKARRGPSLTPACMGCSAVATSAVFKILLGRGRIFPAPWAHQFDFLNNRYARTFNFGGLSNPFNRLRVHFLKKKLGL